MVIVGSRARNECVFAYLSGRVLLNLFPFPLSKTKRIGEFFINGQSAGGNWVHLFLCPLQAQTQFITAWPIKSFLISR
jgi:hypothetical protein